MTPTAAHVSRPKPGETANGDRAYFRALDRVAIAAVVDGLGHGPHAEAAALAALEAIEQAGAAPLEDIFEAAHRALRGTRGAAMTVFRVENGDVTAAGVGNVALRVVRGTALGFVPTPGIVGSNMRSLRVTRAKIETGARVILHTDGVSSRFAVSAFEAGTADEASARVLKEHGGSMDDATVLVVDLAAGA